MDYYTTIAASYETLYKEEQLNKLQLIKDHLQLTGKEQILDIGCGPCWSSQFFLRVVGIDSAWGLLDNRTSVVNGRAEQLPFKDHSFDVLLCVTAVHHFELDKALEEMKRVAKKDAVFVITVLKKSPHYDTIVSELRERFVLYKELDAVQDTAYFCSFIPKSLNSAYF